MQVLLLDEDERSRVALCRLLQADGRVAAVCCVSSPARLVTAYKEKTADLVFIRLGHTSFSGLKAAGALLRADTRAKVIFVSRSRQYARLAFDAGAAGYLLEPVDSAALGRALGGPK